MIITIHGIDFKVGSTMISQCIAERLAQHDKRILLLHMTNQHSMSYISGESGSMDDLYQKLRNEMLTISEFEGLCYKRDNFYTIAGVRTFFIDEAIRYTTDMVNHLLKVVKHKFDHIIVDAGNNIYFGLCMGALLHSDKNYKVIIQNETCLKRLEEVAEPYSELGDEEGVLITFDGMIINKFRHELPYDKKYMEQRVEASRRPELMHAKKEDRELESLQKFFLPYHGSSFQAEMEAKSLLQYKNREYEKGIDEMIAGMFDDDRSAGKNRKRVLPFSKKSDRGDRHGA